MLLPIKTNIDADEIKILELEIVLLETELIQLETQVNAFQSQIRSALSTQILKIQQLTILYKNQKQSKKIKRLAQKKRGKNYKEPIGLKVVHPTLNQNPISSNDQQELKRLYKEAIVQIHPDKFVDADDELNERATAVTVELNKLYQRGDLEELNRLHEHIISGNALTYIADQPGTVKDLPSMMLFLRHKKLKLIQSLEEIKTSAIYELWLNKKDISALISELKIQFKERIIVLEKRTK